MDVPLTFYTKTIRFDRDYKFETPYVAEKCFEL